MFDEPKTLTPGEPSIFSTPYFLSLDSTTEPVTEVLTDNDTGLLIDFFDSDQLSKMITKVLKNKDNYIKIKKNARKKILKDYDLKKVCLPAHLKLINKALK